MAGALANDPDTATRFDGTTGSASVPDTASFATGDRFTVEAWVRRGSISSGELQVIASKQNGSWVLMFNSSNQLVLRRSNVADVAASTRTVTDTTGWHHVAATKDGSAVHLYLDGADVTGSVANQTMANNTMPLAIGQSSTSAYFNGSIDEVAIYNNALTPTQIASRNQPAPPNPPPPTTGDPVIGTAGDIACAPSNSAFNGGLGTPVACRQKHTSDLLITAASARCCPWANDQYDSGTLDEFRQSYAPHRPPGPGQPRVRDTRRLGLLRLLQRRRQEHRPRG